MADIQVHNPLNLTFEVDKSRTVANSGLDLKKKSQLGQFMTPSPIAEFMASLLPMPENNKITLLDPGAGVGSLLSAFVARFSNIISDLIIHVDAFEIDADLHPYLVNNLNLCNDFLQNHGGTFSSNIISTDFISESSKDIFLSQGLWSKDIQKYDFCIMNPPYKKISTSSIHRKELHSIGIETVNLYSAFIALALNLIKLNGSLIAIIPRSFCNGPYYRSFRKYILQKAAIKHIHIFNKRDNVFKDDEVLQENIIIMLERDGIQSDVCITYSSDSTFSDIIEKVYCCSDIVNLNDDESFIHIPNIKESSELKAKPSFSYRLLDIGINVSTGPIVDFRVKEHLVDLPEIGTVPLLYPLHFKDKNINWPIASSKKSNAIKYNSDTMKWLFPTGFYTVIKRFTSKEEKKRIVATVIDPNYFSDYPYLGFENHINVFHINKSGLDENLAYGLAAYLNSSIIDDYFRSFSGHTQVNVTDINNLYFPEINYLRELGLWVQQHNNTTQEDIDHKLETTLNAR